VLLKNVVHPLLAFALVLLLSLHGEAARAAILLAALPRVSLCLVRVALWRRVREAGSTLVVSSLLSIVTLAVVLILTTGI